MSFLAKHQIASALVFFAILVALFYGNTLANGFVQDDVWLIQNNDQVHSLAHLPQAIMGQALSTQAAVYYRPMQGVAYILTYAISGRPAFFHFMNLVYFWGILVALYYLARALTQSSIAAFFTGVAFSIHPIATEVVNWPSAVPELLMTLFALLSFYFYIAYRHQTKSARSFKNIALSFVFYLLAIFSKEPAILLPAIFILVDILLFCRKPAEFLKTKPWARYGLFGVGIVSYGILRLLSIGGVSPIESWFGSFSFGERMYAFFTLFAQYLGKLVYPLPLLFFYTFEKRSDFSNASFLISFIIVTAFFIIMAWMLFRRMILQAFCLAWFVLFISIVVLLPDKLGESVFAERYMFLSTVGFAMLVGYIGHLAWSYHQNMRRTYMAGMIVLACASFFLVFTHNKAWANDDTMYADTLAKNPRADTMRFNWAVLLRQRGNFDEAQKHFATIAKTNPNWQSIVMVYLHLGDYCMEKSDESCGLAYYKQSLGAAYQHGDWKGQFAAQRLGEYHAKKKENIRGLQYFCLAAQLDPQNQDVYKEFDGALKALTENYTKNPEQQYADIAQSDFFERSSQDAISYGKTSCDAKTCTVTFSLAIAPSEIILPSLILARTNKGKAVEIQDSGLSSTGKEAFFKLNATYKDSTLTFFFPTCQGTYYEVDSR